MIKKYKTDLLIIIIIMLIAGLSWVIIHFLNQEKGNYLEISVREKIWKVIPLNRNGTYEIPGKNGTNILVVKDGEAYMKDADCPDRLCVKQGKISKNGESIICLPHQVVVEVVADNETEVDAYAK